MSKEIDPYRVTPDDLEYIKQRPFLQREFILQDLGDPLSEDYPYLVDKDGEWVNGDPTEGEDSEAPSPASDLGDGGETNVQADLPDDQKWDDTMTKDELSAVIAARNEDREDDWVIEPDGKNKGNLLDALRADDQRIAEFQAEQADAGE